MADNRDDLFGTVAIEQGYITPEQLAEAHEGQRAATGLGMELALADVLVSKKILTKEQTEEVMRVVRVRAGDASIVGSYKVLSKIGEGGMGVVYKAQHTETGQQVALKVLPPALARNQTLLKRFMREAETTRTLQHENIVRCIELGVDKERKLHYFAMEFIEGEDLAKRIKSLRRIPESEALSIALQIARALAHASGKGLVHRDVKPQNIMMTPTGTAKLLDLGLARNVETQDTRLTQAGLFAGSPHYASPEQAQGERETDIRSDIYSLGATLYHMVTGKTPFTGDSPGAVLAQVVSSSLPWPSEICSDVSESTSRVIEKAMARDKNERYQNPAQMIDHLEAAIDGRPLPSDEILRGKSVIVRSGGRRVRTQRSLERVQARSSAGTVYGVIGGVIALAVVLIVVFTSGGGSDTRLPAPARSASLKAPVVPAPVKKPENKDKRLQEMLDYATEYAATNPDEYERAITNFRKVQREGRGTRFELLADTKAQEIRDRRKKIAADALDAAEKKASAAFEASDLDAALAAFDNVPPHLRVAVQTEIDSKRRAILDRGKRLARDLADAVDAALARNDIATAKTALKELSSLRYTAEQVALSNKVRTLAARIRAAEQLRRTTAASKAVEALPPLLSQYEQALKKGEYAAARTMVADASKDRAFASVVDTLAAATRVADELVKRDAAMRDGARKLVGKTHAFHTAKGRRRGQVKSVDEAGIAISTRIIINGVVQGESESRLAWGDLTPATQDRLAEGWTVASADAHIAKAYLRMASSDVDGAEEELGGAAGHPLAERVKQGIDDVRLGEVEAAARAAWRPIEARGDLPKLTRPQARELVTWLDEFEAAHGKTKHAASVAGDIAKFHDKAAEYVLNWVEVKPGELRVQNHMGASAVARGDELVVTVPAARGSHADIQLLGGVSDARIKFEFNGPGIEMFLRKISWRGTILALMMPNVVRIRAYPKEDQNNPRVMTANTTPGIIGPGWHTVDIQMKGRAFSLTLDGKTVSSATDLQSTAGGTTNMQIWNTRGGSLRLRNVSYAIAEPRSATQQGIMANKGPDFAIIKEDGEGFIRRYTLIDPAGGGLNHALANELKGIVTTVRVEFSWTRVGGTRVLQRIAKQPHPTQSGTVTGMVIDQGPNYVDVKPDDEPPRRYIPRWIGGMPHQGGGPEKHVAIQIAQVRVGNRVKVDWVYDSRRRVTAIQVLAAGGTVATPRIAPGVKLRQTFETNTAGWQVIKFAPQVIGTVTRASAPGMAHSGKTSLALQYSLQPLTIPVMVCPARNINHLSLWAKTLNRPAELVVAVQEGGDDSRYQSWLHLEPKDGWKHIDLDLATLNLADDSKDENGHLDFDQISNMLIIDIGGILLQSGDNTLLIDDVVGEFRAAGGKGAGERRRP